jgi:hypothetical protein
MESLLTEEENKLAAEYAPGLLDDMHSLTWKPYFSQRASRFSLSEIEELIHGRHGELYGDILRYQYIMFTVANITRSEGIERNSIPPWHTGSWSEYLSDITISWDEHARRLTGLLEVIRSLRDAIYSAMDQSYLSQEELDAMKARLEAFGEYYARACEVDPRGPLDKILINDRFEHW